MSYERLTEEKKVGKFDINCPDYTDEEKRKHLAIVLCGMRKRCYSQTSNCYKNYGGRGITVCDEWMGKDGQKNFYEWAIANGYRKGLTIDRINNDGNYTPENCRWATIKTQAYNRSTNSYITIKGKTQTVAEWADEIGISRGAMQNRLRYGWSEDRLLEPTQVHLNMSKHEMRLEILKLREENKSYRDKIESGKLAELPCGKPCENGDKYYIIDVKRQKIFKGEITYINYDKTYGYICQFSWKDRDYMVPSNLELLGTFFNEQLNHFHMYKTQAEAEEKLRELRGEKK